MLTIICHPVLVSCRLQDGIILILSINNFIFKLIDLKEKPKTFILLKAWQIIELSGLALSIPLIFIFSILFTGDSYKVFNFVNSYIITSVAVILIIKIVAFIGFLKSKLWTIYFNLIQNTILLLASITLTILTIYNGAFSILQIIFVFLYIFLTWVFYDYLITYKKLYR